ncbi:M81 family metallopeptidase [Pseudoroseicyclus sp. H15]
MTLRIAIVGFVHEAMTRSPYLTTRETVFVDRGEAVLDVSSYRVIPGIVARLREDPEVEIVPLIFARALSGGSLEPAFYEEIKAETVDLLKEHGPFDGVMIGNHGAMEVDGFDRHGDTDFILAVREAVGPDVPLGDAFDHHGQITPEMLAELQAISGLRTAPHRDQFETGYRCTGQLLDVIRGKHRPVRAMVQLPMHIPGEKAMTQYEPAKSLFGEAWEIDKDPGVIESTMMLGFGWNDRPWVKTQAVVVTDGDAELAKRKAIEWARKIWESRAAFTFEMEHYDVDEGLEVAAAAPERPLYLTDSGDNVSAGAGGDLTFLLQKVIDHPGLDDVVVTGLFAPELLRLCQEAGEGAEVVLPLGAHHKSAPVQVKEVTARVEALGDAIELTTLDPNSMAPRRSVGAWARVRIGNVIATFHAVRIYIASPQHYEALGIHPTEHKTYVAKFGYLLPALEDIAARFILLVSEGAGNMDYDALDWVQIDRPAWPMDKGATWVPEDNLFVSEG